MNGRQCYSLEMTSPSRPACWQEQQSALRPATPQAPVISTAYPPSPKLEGSAAGVTVAAATKAPDLLQQTEDFHLASPNIPSDITRRLYISHFLSTWNSRSFEFGAVLFLASIFPMTLLPLSIYALVCSASAIVLAPLIGRTIDRRSRLPVVRFSIGKVSSMNKYKIIKGLEGYSKDTDFLIRSGKQLEDELQ